MKSEGANTPATSAGTDGKGGGKNLCKDKGKHKTNGELSVDGGLDPLVATPEDFRKKKGKYPQHKPAHRRLDVFGNGKPFEESVSHAIKEPDVEEADDRANKPEKAVEGQLGWCSECEPWNLKDGSCAVIKGKDSVAND